jgi:pimeloyl-ACP methyl ester carboxylesterase
MPEPHRSVLLDFLLAVADAGGGETVAQYLSRFASLAGQTEVAGSRALEEIDVPVLVMWGEKDRFLPLRHARRAARALPRARLRIIAGAGHSPNWEMPEAVAAGILDLVRSHPD